MNDQIVEFEDWERSLKEGVPANFQAEYREAVVKFRYWLRETGKPATVEAFREHLAWKKSYLAPEKFKIRRQALRWYWEKGRALRGRAVGGSGLVAGGRASGQESAGKLPALRQVEEAVGSRVGPADNRGLATNNQRPAINNQMTDVPTKGAVDLGNEPWERKMVVCIRTRHLAWTTETTYRSWARRLVRFCLLWSHSILNLPWMTITKMEDTDPVRVEADYVGPVSCPHCASRCLRKKAPFVRQVRHESIGARLVWLVLRGYKYLCPACGRYFRQRFPGLLSYQRATEPFKSEVCQDHHDGVCQSRLARRMRLGTATLERWYHRFLERKMAERVHDACPRVLGIDEHFFTRKAGFATTFCDLRKHRVFDVVLGRSETALEGYLARLKGKERVRVVCMDLSGTYRAIVRRHFPRALIVADCFHVIRLIGHHVHQLWRQIDPAQRWNRGLLSLLRRRADRLDPRQRQALEDYFQSRPAIAALYRFKQELWELLRPRGLNPPACRPRIRELLDRIWQLKNSPFAALASLGQTLEDWQEEIARMWRFNRNNGITEGFHTKMEMISRRAFGFKNFDNYRLRVRACCC